ncbi:L-threonylcarbamoyladenylate synthase [Tenacibaculum sp. UWU-22]|uniref:L-threonylcarbamoyladenylate synthase n=1 Tax=Tenacibaculum sp. UWU-22 TaxID=3234187 RepID=UPI0034DB38BA
MNLLKEVIFILKNKKIILYPTDTVWGIGCDATDEIAVKKIYALKNREETKSLIILVDSIVMLKQYVEKVPEKALEIIQNATKPTTIIYKNPKNLAKNTIAQDNTIAIRIAQDDFCKQLIKAFKKPIVSTSANVSGEPTPRCFSEISKAILNNVDYVVDLHREKITQQSSIILKIEDGKVSTIRE